MTTKDPIGDLMKSYENETRHYLTKKVPVIIRYDGKAFHSLTSKMERPFDIDFVNYMTYTAKMLCMEIQGAKLAYTQSDEISILLTDYDKDSTEGWFNYNLSKMLSVGASYATYSFNLISEGDPRIHTIPLFDARAFNVPVERVQQAFEWRQADCVRNSITMLAQSHFSHKQLDNKSTRERLNMLNDIGVDWNDLPENLKQGTMFVKELTRTKAYVPAGPNAGEWVDCDRNQWVTKPAVRFSESSNLFKELLNVNELSV